MRRLITWLIMVPAALAVVVFALNNKAPVVLNLWPFAVLIEVELYILLTGILGVGVVLGGVVSWAGAARLRARLRKQTYEAEVARRELQTERALTAQLKTDLHTLKSAPAHISTEGPQTIEHGSVPTIAAASKSAA